VLELRFELAVSDLGVVEVVVDVAEEHLVRVQDILQKLQFGRVCFAANE